jgi:hypothetical protein
MKTFKNDAGFTAVEAIIIVVIVALVGLSGWFVYHRSHKSAAAATKTTGTVPSTPVKKTPISTVKLDTKYTDTSGNFSVMYPSSWKVQTEHGNQGDGTDAPTTATTLTSPKGTVLELDSNWGGKGGGCEPRDSDKPFTAGNLCPSKEYLSSEPLPIDSVYYSHGSDQPDGSEKFIFLKTDIVLVTSHYEDTDGKSQYTVSLRQWDKDNTFNVGDSVMGFLTSYDFIPVYGASGGHYPYIYVNASGSDASFLQSDDVNIIKSILRTMTVNL